MRLDNYSVAIPNGTELDNGYVELNHGQQYSIFLTSFLNRRCAAEVNVDGKHVGTFRLAAFGQLMLERPSNDTGRFTFYEAGSSEAFKVDVNKISTPDRGLISVTFKPEKEQAQEVMEYKYRRPRGICGQSATMDFSSAGGQHTNSVKCCLSSEERNVSSGVTGLSGQSNQKFRTVGNLDYDEAGIRTINLRLVVANNGPRPLVDAAIKATPIPSPVA